MTDRTSHDDLSDCMPDVDVIMREARHGRGEQKMRDALSRDTPPPPPNDAFEGEEITPPEPWASKHAPKREASPRDAPEEVRSAPLVPRASHEAKSLQKRLREMPFWMQATLGVGAVAAPCILMFVLLVWKQDGPGTKGERAPDTTPSGAMSTGGAPSARATAMTSNTAPSASATATTSATIAPGATNAPSAEPSIKPPLHNKPSGTLDDPYRDAAPPPQAKTVEVQAPPVKTVEPQAPPPSSTFTPPPPSRSVVEDKPVL